MDSKKFRKNIKFKPLDWRTTWQATVQSQSQILRYIYEECNGHSCFREIGQSTLLEEIAEAYHNATLNYGKRTKRYTSITFHDEASMAMLLLKIPSNY